MKKILKDWGLLAVVFLTLYLTGLHTHVAAFAQQMVLKTGFITPDYGIAPEKAKDADFNFPLTTIDGQPASLSDFKGKVIFLNLWATWCPPCRAEMPDIQKLYEQKGSDDIVFVMLSLDKDPNKPKAYIDKKKFTFPVFTPAGNVPEVFKSQSIPTTYVISPEGKIVSKNVGMAKYNTKAFRNYLTKLATKEK